MTAALIANGREGSLLTADAISVVFQFDVFGQSLADLHRKKKLFYRL